MHVSFKLITQWAEVLEMVDCVGAGEGLETVYRLGDLPALIPVVKQYWRGRWLGA